ncbi:DUF6090 family protein [Portibacter marinus]|uniref:DUF6090 family protein n=1 Tax=Portibacter marinus TaxID=2898660 RepID=UPI001F299D7E|nr:DUF6090 family protein [Portibacter marinus]
MIKFFKQIRRKLLDENMTTKYLKYAVGEILLVVIGILIALQINNWNEKSKEIAAGLGYLKRLDQDLTKDSSYLDSKIKEASEAQKSFENYIRSIQKEQSSTEEFMELTASVFWDSDNLLLEDRTYNEITNSGKFSYIKNDSLRNLIMNYYLRYGSIDNHISEMNQTGIRLFEEPYKRIIKFYPIFEDLFDREVMINNTEWKFINDPENPTYKDLESAAIYYLYKFSIFEAYYKELKEMGGMLIERIEQEMEAS